MRILTLVAFGLFASMATSSGQVKDGKVDFPKEFKKDDSSSSPKVDAESITKAFNLKITKIKWESKGLTLTFEFTKKTDDLPSLHEVFRPFKDNSDSKEPKENREQPKVLAYVFDVENVLLTKRSISTIAGEISGRAGEAFRIHFEGVNNTSELPIGKVEIRLMAPLRRITDDSKEK